MNLYRNNTYSRRPMPTARARVVSRTRQKAAPVYSDFLVHYGISGQKWGERRFQNEDGSYTEEGKIRYNKKSESETWKKSDLRNLSDDELNMRNSRLQRERQYRDLTTTERERDISQFKKDVIKKALVLPLLAVIGIAGRKYIGQAATKVASVIGKYGKRAIGKIGSSRAAKNGANTFANQAKRFGENYGDPFGPLKRRPGVGGGARSFLYRGARTPQARVAGIGKGDWIQRVKVARKSL